MITLMSFMRDGKLMWKALTPYGGTMPYSSKNEARLAAFAMIAEAR